MNRSPLLAAAFLAAVSSGCSSTSPSSGGARVDVDEFRPIASGDTLYVWSAGLDAMLVDPKDAGVRDALRHMGERVLELPAEMGDPEFPADAIELGASCFLGPMSLSVGPTADGGAAGMPVRAQIDFKSSTPEEARRRADRLTAALSMVGAPSLGLDEATGLSVLDVSGFTVRHGVAREGRPDTLVIGSELDFRPRDLGTLDLPRGVVPVAAYRLDYGSLMEMASTFGGPEAAAAMESAGLGDVVIQGGMGHGDDRSYASVRTIDWVPLARENGSLPTGTIEREALARIPRDATMAMVVRTNFDAIARAVDMAMGAGSDDGMDASNPLAMVGELLGVDFETDLVANLGETVGVYTSDSTGGGGLWSGVAFMRVKDEAALRTALDRVAANVEDYAADQGFDALTLRRTQHAGAQITTLAFSGWPIPVEPSWTIRDGWFYAAASVQGLRAALDQAAEGGDDLLDNDAFMAQASGSLDDLVSLTFVDSARFARDGYPLATMIGSALSNSISSVAQPDRVPPGIVPGFADFTRGVRASVALGRIVGDDHLVLSQGDRSMLVQAATVVGALGPLPLFLVGAIAAGAEEEEAQAFPFTIEDEIPMDGFEDMDEEPDGAMDGDAGMDDALDLDVDDLVTDPTPGEPK